MQCRICGGPNDETARFCVTCGTALKAQSPPGAAPRPNPSPLDQVRMTVQPPPSVAKPVGPPTSQIQFAETAPPQPSIAGMVARKSPPPAASWDPNTLSPDAPRTLVGFLISFEINPLGQYWPIWQGQNLIGRTGAMPGLSIEIGHPTTSSRHAVLYAATAPSRVLFEDLSSTNGSFVNDIYLPPGIKRDIKDSDVIRLGLFSATLKLV